MPENIKELIIVLGIGATVLLLAKPVMLRFCSVEDYRRRAAVWVCLSAAAFLAPGFWWFVLLAAPLLFWAGRTDSHPVALYLLLLQVVPSIFVEIPIVGINKLFALDIYRLLSLSVLVPAAWRAYRSSRAHGAHGLDLQDVMLLGYGALQIIFYVRPDLVSSAMVSDSFTNGLRRAFLFFIDAYVVYFAVSRYCVSRRSLVEALACLCLCATIAAPIAVFESLRHWLVYGSIAANWSIDPAVRLYTMRDHVLRAQAASGDPLSLGYLLAIGCGLWLYLWHWVDQVPRKSLAIFGLWLGLLAAYSRGPWLGALAVYLIYAAAGPQRLSALLRTGGVLCVLAVALLLSPFGQKVIDALPFLGGSVDSANLLYRRQLASLSWQLIQQHPLLGDRFAYAKLGVMRQGQGIIDVVNTYLQVALFYGLIGLTLFGGFMAVGMFKIYGIVRRSLSLDADLAALGASLLACCAGTLLMLADCSFIFTYSTLYYVLGGFAAAYARFGALAHAYPARSPAPQVAPRLYPLSGARRS